MEKFQKQYLFVMYLVVSTTHAKPTSLEMTMAHLPVEMPITQQVLQEFCDQRRNHADPLVQDLQV